MKKKASVRPVNVFYGHILTGVMFMGIAIWGTTQFVAYKLGYQPQLGDPWFVLGGYPVYYPWMWWLWAFHFGPYAPWVFETAKWMVYGLFACMIAVMILLGVRRIKKGKNAGTYGTARWAATEDLKNAGLMSGTGVILAQSNDAKFHSHLDENNNPFWTMKRHGKHILSHNGPEHISCFAPTRSGKGVGLVIPTLLSWTGSAIIYDIKKELWEYTAGWRQKFSHCLLFEPTSELSLRYNPFFEIRSGINEVRDAQNIADILIDPEGSLEKRDHWEKTAHTVFVGAILHILYACEDKSLRGLVNFLSDPSRTIFETLHVMLKTNHLKTGPHPVVASCAREALNKSENELSGVISTALTFLGLFRDPIIADNTSVSDFKIADLMNSDKPVSLYIVVPPSDIDRTKPLVRLMLNQIGRRLTEKMTFKKKTESKADVTKRPDQGRHRLLLMFDEFASLGRLTFFETELAFLAGYGIKCFLIFQSLNQIIKTYGPNSSILDNCHVRITYGALDDQTAKRISDLLGQGTELKHQVNLAGSRLSPWLDHVMASEQETPRQLLTPGEILQLPGDDAIVMVGGCPPYRAKKIMYYQDTRFMQRALIDPPMTEDEILAEIPSQESRTFGWVNVLPGAVVADDPDGFADDADSVFGEADPEKVSHAKLGNDGSVGVKQNAEPDEKDPDKEINLQELVNDSENSDNEKLLTSPDEINRSNDDAEKQKIQQRLRAMQQRVRNIEMGRETGGGDLPL